MRTSQKVSIRCGASSDRLDCDLQPAVCSLAESTRRPCTSSNIRFSLVVGRCWLIWRLRPDYQTIYGYRLLHRRRRADVLCGELLGSLTPICGICRRRGNCLVGWCAVGSAADAPNMLLSEPFNWVGAGPRRFLSGPLRTRVRSKAKSS